MTVETIERVRARVAPKDLMEAPPLPAPPPTMRVAYLLSRYPAVSHTFFLHEVLGLRTRGMHIETASINPTDRPFDELPENEAVEASHTFYIKTGNTARMFGDVAATILRYPGALGRGLKALLGVKNITIQPARLLALLSC